VEWFIHKVSSTRTSTEHRRDLTVSLSLFIHRARNTMRMKLDR
jgi:hypothetical protein